MKSLISAFQFLTIIPIKGETSEADITRSVSAFPLVGLLQGAMLAGTAYIAGLYLPTISASAPGGVSSAIVLIVLVVSSGGLHLDGLSDTFDAIAKRGDRDEKLRVMKDGRAGAIGVSAVCLALLLKYLCIASLSANFTSGAFYALLFLMPVLSKWAMVASMFHGKPARRGGLGALFIEGTTAKRALAATFYALLIAFSFSHFLIKDAAFAAVALAPVYITGVISARFFGRQFGGHTGDTLGATGEVSDIVFLLTAIIWQKNSF